MKMRHKKVKQKIKLFNFNFTNIKSSISLNNGRMELSMGEIKKTANKQNNEQRAKIVHENILANIVWDIPTNQRLPRTKQLK